jgi:hypothetical protein
MKWMLLIFLAGLFFLSCAGSAESGSSIDFLTDSHWNEGNAEFQTYEAQLLKYGEMRSSEVKMIIVKEPFDMREFVKSDTADNYVLKLNYIRTIPAGMYDYYQMMSIFFESGTGKIVKFSMGSQDGCGNTYAEYTSAKGKGTLRWYSYFDDQGRKKADIDLLKTTIYDALPVVLRYRLDYENPYQISFYNSFIANKYTPPKLVKGEVINQLSGEYIETTLTYGNGKKDTLRFEREFPHALIRWERDNGELLSLSKSYFTDYWNYTGTEDRELVEDNE